MKYSARRIVKAKLTSTSGTGVTLAVGEGVAVCDAVTLGVTDAVWEPVRVSEGVDVGVPEAVMDTVEVGVGVCEGVTLAVADGGVMHTLFTGSYESQKPRQEHAEEPPRLTALLGQARHTSAAPLSPLLVLLAPHVQVRASAPLTPLAGHVTQALPAVTL